MLASVLHWLCGINNFRKEMEDLRNLTDRDLKDLGLNRGDVDAMAKGVSVNRHY
jgi:hypothetical protein